MTEAAKNYPLVSIPKKYGVSIAGLNDQWAATPRSAIAESWVSTIDKRDCDVEHSYQVDVEQLSGSYHWQMPSGLPPGNDFSPMLFGLAAAYDSFADLSVRVDALRHRLLVSDLDAKNYLTAELLRDQQDIDWQNELVFLAESQQFYEPELREALSRRLVSIGMENVFERAGSLDATASAIRTACSMMPEHLIEELLLPLLATPVAIDVRSNVFIGIANIFEQSPPTQRLRKLSHRVHELAVTFLQPDLMVAGENSVFGQTAVLALAHLADERTIDCAATLKHLGVRWYNLAIKRDLAQLLDRWRGQTAFPIDIALEVLSAG